MLREVCGPVAVGRGNGARGRDLRRSRRRRRRGGFGATILIRGLRDGTDLDYEMQMAGMNETHGARAADRVSAGIARGPPHHRHACAPDRRHGRRRSRFVPPLVAARLNEKFAAR